MRDTIKYYDRNGILKLTLNKYPYYSELADLKNWVWGYNTQFGKINTFYRNKQTYELIIGVASEHKAQHDILCDIFTADVIAESPGHLEINGWTLPCYITESQHDYAQELDRKFKFVVRSTTSTWVRSKTKSYNGIAGGGSASDEDLGRDYTYEEGLMGRGYNYGYNMPESHYASIDLPGEGNGYEIMIYGPQINPVIYLNNQPVQINVTIEENERLHIVSNGNDKTIKILSSNGAEKDAFVYRDKENSPFLELGQHTELTYGQVRFDFTTIERRSEPSWN